MICRNGGLIGAITNGGFAEYIEYMKGDCSRHHYYIDLDLAASLPCLITPYHALKEASLKVNR